MPLSNLLLIPIVGASLVCAGPECRGEPAVPAVASVVCGAPRPTPGARIEGPVLHVFDGRTLCIAQGPTPSEWVRVTLDGAPSRPRNVLMAAVFAKRVVCVAGRRDREGVVARCSLEDVPLTQLTSSAAARNDAAIWR